MGNSHIKWDAQSWPGTNILFCFESLSNNKYLCTTGGCKEKYKGGAALSKIL